MLPAVGGDGAELRYWKEVLASEAIRPAARRKVAVDDLVQEALVRIWREGDRWKWPPAPSALAKFLYRVAREMADSARNEARRRSRLRRKRRPAQVPPLCKRLKELLALVRKPRQYEDIVLSAAMAVAPAELPKGRFREADHAWRQDKTLSDIAITVRETPSVVRKRLVRASGRLEGAIFDAIRNLLSARAERSLHAYRPGATLPDEELSELAEEVASVLERLHSAGDTDTDGPGTQPGETRIS